MRTRWGSTKITARSFEWRCDQCGMKGRKEPHLRLRDHMERTHNKVWDAEKQDFISTLNANMSGGTPSAESDCYANE